LIITFKTGEAPKTTLQKEAGMECLWQRAEYFHVTNTLVYEKEEDTAVELREIS
jgi:hypothetical protein